MKPLYIFLLMWAVFITALADGISAALLPVPGIGVVIALAITFSINATMGAGLVILLASQGMFHPKFGPAAILGGLMPGLNFLPFWVGFVISGIIYKMNKEGSSLALVANVALRLQTSTGGKTKFESAKMAAKFVMEERRGQGRPQSAANDNDASDEPQNEQDGASSTRTELKNPSLAPRMNSDIAPARNQQYAKAA